MDWDLDAGTESDAVPETEHGWVAQQHDPDLSAGGYGSDDGDVVYDEDHYDGTGSVDPLDHGDEPDESSGSGHGLALPVDTDGDGDYDRVLVDRDGDGDYDRAVPYGDSGQGRR
jgi:hypothetical protein